MRTLMILGILLVAFIASGIYVQHYLAETGSDLAKQTLMTITAVRTGNWPQAKRLSTDLARHWDAISKRWNLYTEHEEIDAINGTVSRLHAYIEEEDSSGAIAEATAALHLFNHIPQKEKITLDNIL